MGPTVMGGDPRSVGFVVILEVCRFHDWLLGMLREYACQEIVLVQVDERSKTNIPRHKPCNSSHAGLRHDWATALCRLSG